MRSLYEEVVAKIIIQEDHKGKDHWFEASCPICQKSEQSTVLGSPEIAKIATRGKVLTHLAMAHGIRNEETQNS